MFEVKLTLNGEIIIPAELSHAQNINDFDTLKFKIQRSHIPLIKIGINNLVELVINGEQIFSGFILTCNFDSIMGTFICVPHAYVVNITNMPQVTLTNDLEIDMAPQEIIRKCLQFPSSILGEPIPNPDNKTFIVDYQTFDLGNELVRVDLFKSYTETPASLIKSLLSNRNVVMTNNGTGELLVGTIPSIYSDQTEHEVISFMEFNTTHNFESIRSAYGVMTPVIISGVLGGNIPKVYPELNFSNISVKEVQPSTYPLAQTLKNIQTQDLFNYVQVSLETQQNFKLGDIIKNKDFSPLITSFIVAGKQLNLDNSKMNYNYLLRHRDSLNVI